MKLSKALMLLVVAILVGLAGCGPTTPKVDWELTLGDQAFSYADLTGMAQTELDEIVMERSLGEKEVGSWSGVALSDLLEAAGVTDYSSITAVAADGYAIDITRDELQDAIVALKRDGEWLTEVEPDKGPIRLVSPNTPANRWVFQLQELQVNQ
jgi:DMSO/TMAO reductase YedYZ molybdopterin-dependent catalytic subunit